MAMIDASAAATMQLASEVLAGQETIRRQQKQIWALVTVLRAERATCAALVDLLDSMLGDLDG
jgi:hypothetical protein